MSVILRPWQPEDAPALRRAHETTADLDTQFGSSDVSTDERAADFIESDLSFGDAAKNWAVVVDGRAVGNIGLSAIERRHQTAWAYYWLASFARGRGYASGGLAAVSDWAHADGIFRLELGHRVNNPASCRVASAVGFLPEGIERQKLLYGNRRFDVEIHARLATDPSAELGRLTLRTSR
ncbi:GNAT family N-acetyltransferase (plasmid) [Coraliomargarita sp. W4R53]